MFFKASPKADPLYYRQLEEGARWLAAGAACAAERDAHLGMADLYARRASSTGASADGEAA